MDNNLTAELVIYTIIIGIGLLGVIGITVIIEYLFKGK